MKTRSFRKPYFPRKTVTRNQDPRLVRAGPWSKKWNIYEKSRNAKKNRSVPLPCWLSVALPGRCECPGCAYVFSKAVLAAHQPQSLLCAHVTCARLQLSSRQPTAVSHFAHTYVANHTRRNPARPIEKLCSSQRTRAEPGPSLHGT